MEQTEVYRLSNGNEVSFINESRDTRNGFMHACSLIVNGNEVSCGKCYYLNRTWEVYRYQSCMRVAVQNHLDALISTLTQTFKEQNGYKIITSNRKQALKEVLDSNIDVMSYRQLLNAVDKQSGSKTASL